MTQNQKDAFLREQVRVIQEELGEGRGQRDHRLPPPDHAEAKLPEEVTE